MWGCGKLTWSKKMDALIIGNRTPQTCGTYNTRQSGVQTCLSSLEGLEKINKEPGKVRHPKKSDWRTGITIPSWGSKKSGDNLFRIRSIPTYPALFGTSGTSKKYENVTSPVAKHGGSWHKCRRSRLHSCFSFGSIARTDLGNRRNP